MSCNEGYSFNSEAMTMYGCGPDTNWKWNGVEKPVLSKCSSTYDLLKCKKDTFLPRSKGVQFPPEIKKRYYANNRMHNVILSKGICHVLSVCGLCSNLATMEVSCPMKNRRVSQLSTKGWLSRRLGLLLLLLFSLLIRKPCA